MNPLRTLLKLAIGAPLQLRWCRQTKFQAHTVDRRRTTLKAYANPCGGPTLKQQTPQLRQFVVGPVARQRFSSHRQPGRMGYAFP